MDSLGRAYFIYIVASRSRCIYTGITGQIRKRIWKHKTHEYLGFTDRYQCERLVFVEMFNDPYSAIAREKQIKGWNRSKKIALIESENPNWNDLAESWYDQGDLRSIRARNVCTSVRHPDRREERPE